MTIRRVVFDTNAILMPLTRGSRSAHHWIVQQWENGSTIPLSSQETRQELTDTLRKPHFKLQEEQVQAISARYSELSLLILMPQHVPGTPRCRDPSDQKFVDLAHYAQADMLVTKDPDVLDLNQDATIPILSLQDFTRTMNHPE